MTDVLLESGLPNRSHRGKVRDTYDLGDQLLIVATDRISALDVVLPTGIPRKGEVLTRLSAWWFDRIKEVVPNHFVALITAETAGMLPFPLDERYYGRSMLVRKARRLPAECIARGYLSGTGWKDYQRTGAVCGIPLPPGLRESERLPEPLFTPSTKAEVGHDENITYEQLAALTGEEAANAMRLRTLAVYNYAHAVALERGIIIADTKLEFGYWNDEVILIDEVLTPDSSRFWPVDGYAPGGACPSFDKQPVRDWLAANWREGDPAPPLPPDVVEATTRRYMAVFKMLTGEELPE
ncbi:MAG: phosphoribosylaminoimidazolesuccinocarboxamide synthase [Dehalococcoidia bacterium]|nr:MAG: phosphoribosylaminoimidazolesuccinocarboxamide synthase [bacterium]MCE7927178.1 phosphoribosylaminoimidazolesuccinocarboxamide synthase [Chloroflexi bacterium CFX7]MCK6565195.1 phosphoribosylaminoimidazolesuccinocarboxamide synthase [Dehalococcoidia bacterium]MCL4230108.1 phosphoribosylaminoimidazolesuccinocarboxamide synthase [Dehalococcoidia bacterium]NUQ55757.1 phosphoribosylaminoimidazolesuccinocarboxamide synthase [Dehalococcoidia bacterium]